MCLVGTAIIEDVRHHQLTELRIAMINRLPQTGRYAGSQVLAAYEQMFYAESPYQPAKLLGISTTAIYTEARRV
jgi:hypothetical protein